MRHEITRVVYKLKNISNFITFLLYTLGFKIFRVEET